MFAHGKYTNSIFSRGRFLPVQSWWAWFRDRIFRKTEKLFYFSSSSEYSTSFGGTVEYAVPFSASSDFKAGFAGLCESETGFSAASARTVFYEASVYVNLVRLTPKDIGLNM